MAPARARKLAGKLSWGASMVFGRGARVYLAPLFQHAEGKQHKMSRRLTRALEWWTRFLRAVPVRTLPAEPRPGLVATVYSDATGHGHLAWVAEVGQRRVFARCKVPAALCRWVCRRKTQVATWELVAALCALWHIFGDAALDAQSMQINLFIDSNVALGTLLRGASRQQDWNELVSGIWFEAASRAALLLAWRVPSKLNLADSPTRALERSVQLEALLAAGFHEVSWEWPAQAPWQVAASR